MKFAFPERVENNFNGYEIFTDLYDRTGSLILEMIYLDFRKTTWMEANLSAVLGAILDHLAGQLNTLSFQNLSPSLSNILKRNHFLGNFGSLKIKDYYHTTIKYRKFKTTEEKFFKEYLDNELLSKEGMPGMSARLRKKINESIFEIFNNAAIHGDCRHVFTCGQYYPSKKKLDFTMVDLGKTIKANVSRFLSKKLSGVDCISWAVKEGNTTKTGNIPGGLGLSLIREFLKKNGGMIQVVSADGYWEQRKSNAMGKILTKSFPGTIANLEFNLADTAFYQLASEVTDDEDIF